MSNYHDFRKGLKEQQQDLSREEILKLLEQQGQVIADLDNLPAQNHRWVDRGLVMSCEGAAHENHRHYKSLVGKTA